MQLSDPRKERVLVCLNHTSQNCFYLKQGLHLSVLFCIRIKCFSQKIQLCAWPCFAAWQCHDRSGPRLLSLLQQVPIHQSGIWGCQGTPKIPDLGQMDRTSKNPWAVENQQYIWTPPTWQARTQVITYLQHDHAYLFHTLDDGIGSAWYSDCTLCWVWQHISCYLHLGSCGLEQKQTKQSITVGKAMAAVHGWG